MVTNTSSRVQTSVMIFYFFQTFLSMSYFQPNSYNAFPYKLICTYNLKLDNVNACNSGSLPVRYEGINYDLAHRLHLLPAKAMKHW